MLEAVFISDLHLHPDNDRISTRFNQFIEWVANKTHTLYILGDFFHAWPGDDGINVWSRYHLKRLHWLSSQGVAIYFIAGNRDFLVGKTCAATSGMTLLSEPAVINCGNCPILLVHGDRYCTNDKAHQWLRRFTRNRWFPRLFLMIPLRWRTKLVAGVRAFSQANRSKPLVTMDVVASTLLNHLQQQQVTTVIHGHTHKPGLTTYNKDGCLFKQYVLSDWDDSPEILCYDKTKGFYFTQMTT